MLRIQISYSPSVQQHQIVLLCKPYEIEFSNTYVRLIDAVPLLNTSRIHL